MFELRFYTTEGCHLCEQALTIIREVHAANPLIAKVIQLKLIDIADEDVLIEAYGNRIPVVAIGGQDKGKQNNAAELNWPFHHQEYIDLLNREFSQA